MTTPGSFGLAKWVPGASGECLLDRAQPSGRQHVRPTIAIEHTSILPKSFLREFLYCFQGLPPAAHRSVSCYSFAPASTRIFTTSGLLPERATARRDRPSANRAFTSAPAATRIRSASIFCPPNRGVKQRIVIAVTRVHIRAGSDEYPQRLIFVTPNRGVK